MMTEYDRLLQSQGKLDLENVSEGDTLTLSVREWDHSEGAFSDISGETSEWKLKVTRVMDRGDESRLNYQFDVWGRETGRDVRVTSPSGGRFQLRGK